MSARTYLLLTMPTGLLLAVLFLPIRFARAGVEGDIELIRLLGEGQRTNVEKIGTWKGKVSMTRRESGTALIPHDSYFDRRTAAFAFDAARSAKRWNVEFLECRATREGVELAGSGLGPHFAAGLLKGKEIYRLGPIEKQQDKHPYTCKLDAFPRAGTWLLSGSPYDFDPFEYFGSTFDPRVPSLLDRYEEYKAKRDTLAGSTTIQRSGTLVVTEHTSSTGRIVIRRTYDLSKGCNIVEAYEEERGSGTTVMTYEYEKRGGAWVPKKVTEHVEAAEGPQAKTLHVERVFEEQSVNEPLNDSDFSLEAIGLQAGDIIQDNRTGVKYTYGLLMVEPQAASGQADGTAEVVDLLLEGISEGGNQGEEPPHPQIEETDRPAASGQVEGLPGPLRQFNYRLLGLVLLIGVVLLGAGYVLGRRKNARRTSGK